MKHTIKKIIPTLSSSARAPRDPGICHQQKRQTVSIRQKMPHQVPHDGGGVNVTKTLSSFAPTLSSLYLLRRSQAVMTQTSEASSDKTFGPSPRMMDIVF